MSRIILASASPRRSELLLQGGFQFEVIVSGQEEKIRRSKPEDIVTDLALQKGMAVQKEIIGSAVVIGADTIVVRDGQILGKPKDRDDAISMLHSLQNRGHQVYTGVSVIDKRPERTKIYTFYEKTEVVLYPMTAEQIRDYTDSGEPFDKAGGYGIQGRFAVYIKEIHGDYNNVVGLPLAALYQLIHAEQLIER